MRNLYAAIGGIAILLALSYLAAHGVWQWIGAMLLRALISPRSMRAANSLRSSIRTILRNSAPTPHL